MIRGKSFVGFTIDAEFFVGPQGLLDGLRDPEQHFFEEKQFEEQLRFFVGFPFGELEVNPDPDVSQHQCNRDEQQPQARRLKTPMPRRISLIGVGPRLRPRLSF